MRIRAQLPLFFVLSLTAFLLASASVFAITNGKPYAPGETLDPDCGPEDPSCFVSLPPTFATTTLDMPSIFAVTGTLSMAGIDPASVSLAPQGPNQFLAGPFNRTGEPTFRLITQQDLPNPIHKDTVGTLYGSLIGGNVSAANATTTHLYASVGRFDTLTVGGRVIGADELAASMLCGPVPEESPIISLDPSPVEPSLTELSIPEAAAPILPPVPESPALKAEEPESGFLDPAPEVLDLAPHVEITAAPADGVATASPDVLPQDIAAPSH